MKDNIKTWTHELKGFETSWAHRGEGVFYLSGQSMFPLPTGVYKIDTDGNGTLTYCRVNILDDDLLSLPNSKTDGIINSIDLFWNSKEQYDKLKQVYKRGILLHGEQGCGKTSTLNLLFTKLLMEDGVVIIVDNPELTIKAIQRLRIVEPNRKLILLYEDIDSLFNRYGESELLSMLDGQLQFDNVVNIATTNYIEEIPSRLKNRPGRFDEVIKIDPPTTDERKLYIEHLMRPIEDKSKILEMIKDTQDFSMAHIKELIISVYLLEKDYKETVERLKEMKNV